VQKYTCSTSARCSFLLTKGVMEIKSERKKDNKTRQRT